MIKLNKDAFALKEWEMIQWEQYKIKQIESCLEYDKEYIYDMIEKWLWNIFTKEN